MTCTLPAYENYQLNPFPKSARSWLVGFMRQECFSLLALSILVLAIAKTCHSVGLTSWSIDRSSQTMQKHDGYLSVQKDPTTHSLIKRGHNEAIQMQHAVASKKIGMVSISKHDCFDFVNISRNGIAESAFLPS